MKHPIPLCSFLLALGAASLPSVSLADPPAPPAAQKLTPAQQAAAKKKAAEEARKASRERHAKLKEFQKKVDRQPMADRIAALKEMLADPEMNGDPSVRFAIYELIVRYTRCPAWTRIQCMDWSAAEREVPAVVEKILADEDFSAAQKLKAYGHLVRCYCDLEEYAKAEAAARESGRLPGLSKRQQADSLLLLADVYRYQDRYDEALKTFRRALKDNPVAAAKGGAGMALDFNRPEDARAIWKETALPYDELLFYGKHRAEDDRLADAQGYALDAANPTNRRFEVAKTYCFGDMAPENVAVRKALKGFAAALKSGGWWNLKAIRYPFQLGDYPLAVEMCELYEGSPAGKEVSVRKIHVISLGAVGRTKEAIRLAEAGAADESLKPVDRARFAVYAAILSGKAIEPVVQAAKLPRKEEADVYLTAARTCLDPWYRSDLAKKYSDIYESYFAKWEQRSIEVKYFDEPVTDISAWRKVRDRLEKQYCDIPYKGSMDFLETDVSTGDRGDIKVDEKAETGKYMELTTLCDRYGLHVFLRCQAEDARAIEQGFARGIGSESYFAPGKNQPYVCFGTDPVKGITFFFRTTYDNRNNKRLVKDAADATLKSETAFTDDDYVLHLAFSWDAFYDKLPANGTDWRFECLSWTPAGGFSWGGSQGIHAASAWGNLRFSLTEKQLNEIRREMIYRTYRAYKQVPRDPGVKENLFSCWADAEIGDPAFYETCLKPLEEELDGYAKRVKPGMSDEEVADLFVHALPRWKGLPHEVDKLRREYLAERLVTTGR